MQELESIVARMERGIQLRNDNIGALLEKLSKSEMELRKLRAEKESQ